MALRVLRRAQPSRRARGSCNLRAVVGFADRELRGPSPPQGSIGKFPFQLDDSRGLPLAFPCVRLVRADAGLDPLGLRSASAVSHGVVQRSPLHRDPSRSRLPASVCRLLAQPTLAAFGAGLPGALAPPARLPTSSFGTTSPASSSVSCRGFAPGPDPEVRPVSLRLGSRLDVVPRAAFLPSEASFLAESHPPRSRATSGGPSPRRRCRRRVHRTPCPLVLGWFPFRNLEALLSRRSGSRVRGFPRLRALAPLGLSLPPPALPRGLDGCTSKIVLSNGPFGQ